MAAPEVKHTDRALVKSNGMRFDADMEHPRPEAGVETRTLTAMIAARVRVLRRETRLSGAGLAAGMKDRGIPWNRTTVAKLETGRRESITVPELLALADVLGVPVPWLLVDLTAATAVPFEGIERDPWAVMLWLVGKEPLTSTPGPAWDTAALPIRQACQVATLVERFGQVRTHRENVAALLPDGRDADRALEDERQERRILEDLTRPLRALVRLGFSPPPLPDELVKRAVELDVELDGEG